MKVIYFLAALVAMLASSSVRAQDGEHKKCYTANFVGSLKKRLEVARDAQEELNQLLVSQKATSPADLQKRIGEQGAKINALKKELAEAKKRCGNSDVSTTASPPPAPRTPPKAAPRTDGPTKAELQALKDDLAELKKAVGDGGDTAEDATLFGRVLDLESRLDNTVSRSEFTSLLNNVAELQGKVAEALVKVSPVDVYVGLRAEGIMRVGRAANAWGGGGTICLSGNFSDKWGVLGCGSAGFFNSATTGTGWKAGGMIGPIVGLDDQEDHRLAFGIAFSQFGRVSASEYDAIGNGLGYMVGPEVRYMVNVAGPLVISPVIGLGFGEAAGWDRNNGMDWVPGLEKGHLTPFNGFAIQPYLGIEVLLDTGQ
jgi:hypothetical protein